MEKLIGIVMGYRRGTNTQYENQVLIKVEGIETREQASRLIGRKVVAKDKYGNTYIGKIIGVHGDKGVVRARFRRNLPGQMIAEVVEIL